MWEGGSLDSREGLGLAEIAAKVDFSTEQVARMCAVSRRQLAYWAQKGIIPAQDGYSLATVEKVMLIRRELDRGSTLRRAVERVGDRLAERARFEANAKELSADQVDSVCASQLERLESLLGTIREALPLLDHARQSKLASELAAMSLEEVLNAGISALPPSELLICLNKAVEHLELVVEDMQRAS